MNPIPINDHELVKLSKKNNGRIVGFIELKDKEDFAEKTRLLMSLTYKIKVGKILYGLKKTIPLSKGLNICSPAKILTGFGPVNILCFEQVKET